MSCNLAFDHRPTRVDVITPIAELPSFKQYRVHYSGYRSTFTPWNLDAPSGIVGVTGGMVLESELQGAQGNDIVNYSRVFSEVPGKHINFQTYVYTAPGVHRFTPNPGRPQISKPVISRLTYEYQRVSGAASGNGNLQPSEDIVNFPFQAIPVFRIIYTGTDIESPLLHWDVDYYYGNTVPSADDYFDNIAGTEIPIESDVDLWMGNIFVRKTRYVIAI